MPFVSVANNLFEKEDYTQNGTQDNEETNTNKEDDEDTEENAR
jgi:hypothetical protein